MIDLLEKKMLVDEETFKPLLQLTLTVKYEEIIDGSLLDSSLYETIGKKLVELIKQ